MTALRGRRRDGDEARARLRRHRAAADPGCRRIYLTPDGVPLTPAIAAALAKESHLILLSGHYEGIDQRIRDA
jgi:tRNA (guanine-N1)-methyltransferase